MAEGEGLALKEILGTIMGIILIILSASALLINNSDYIMAKSISDQISYISSISKEDDTQIVINLPNEEININSQGNNVEVFVNDESSKTQNFIGEAQIRSENNQVIIS